MKTGACAGGRAPRRTAWISGEEPSVQDRIRQLQRRRGNALGTMALAVVVSGGLMSIGIATGRVASSSEPRAIVVSPAAGEAARPEQAPSRVLDRLQLWSWRRDRSSPDDRPKRDIQRGASPPNVDVSELPVRPLKNETGHPPEDQSRDRSEDPVGDGAGASTGADARVGARSLSFDGRPIRAVATLRMRVTAYSPDERSCGASADGITASGYSVWTNGGCLVAADPRVLPLGSLVSVEGYDAGRIVPVLDVGGAIRGNRLDVLFPTHEQARRWGVREIDVVVWDYDDGLPNHFRRQRRTSGRVSGPRRRRSRAAVDPTCGRHDGADLRGRPRT